MTIFRFALMRSLRNGYNIGLLLALPLFIVFWPADAYSPLPVGYRYYGIILLFGAAKLVHLILADRMSRIVVRISAAPVTHFQYLLQNLLAFAALLLVQAAVVVACGIPLHGSTFPSPAALFMLYACFSLTAIAFSLAWCSQFRNKETSFIILASVIMLLSMVGGLFWPVELLPAWMQRAAMLLPTYWLAEGLKLVSFGAQAGELLVPAGMLLLFTLVFLLIGSKRRLH